MSENRSSVSTQPLVFVIEALTVGGAEQMLIAMANRFVERGHPVHIVWYRYQLARKTAAIDQND